MLRGQHQDMHASNMPGEQRGAPSNVEGDERYNSGLTASGNSYGYAQQQQGYYFGDAGQQQQHQYSDSGGYQSQAYQQQLAYASTSQPYWYAAGPFAEGSNGAGAQGGGATPEMTASMRDRDVKTQRRKEANRESARRSKQRKKEESELLSSKAQELVRESTSLRAELDKVQKQAEKLYKENLELRNQVEKAGGTLPPSPPPLVAVQLPPPIELPASLFKESGGILNSAVAKKDASDTAEKGEKEKKATTQTKAPATSVVVKANQNVLEEGAIDLPSLLDNELSAGVQQSYPNLGGNDTNGLMSEAIVSFRESERDALFSHNPTLDELEMMGTALRGGTHQFANNKVNPVVDDEDFNFIRRSELGQGGG